MYLKAKNTEKRRQFKFLPLTIGIETIGGISTPLVLRGTPLPAVRRRVFTTSEDNQGAVEIKVLMGESPIASKNIDIATTVLLGIPKMTRGTPQVQVTFEVNNECNITTQAVETQSLEKIVVVSAVTYANLTESSITLTLAKAQSTKFSDYLLLKSIEVVNKAGPLISRAEVILREADHKDISEALAALGLALDGDNVEEKARMVEELERLIPQRSGGEFQGFGSIWDFSKPASTLFDIWDFEMSIVDAPLVDRPTTNKPRPSATASNIGKIFGGGEFTQDPNLCFVLMPSDAHLKPIYDDHIHLDRC